MVFLLVLRQSSSDNSSSMAAVIVGAAGADFEVNVVIASNVILFDGLRSKELFLVITIILYNKIECQYYIIILVITHNIVGSTKNERWHQRPLL